MLNPSRRVLMEICGPFYYPFGNTRSRNILEKVGWKIGGEERNVTKVCILARDLHGQYISCVLTTIYLMPHIIGSLSGMWRLEEYISGNKTYSKWESQKFAHSS